jgi:hypothetical protein
MTSKNEEDFRLAVEKVFEAYDVDKNGILDKD